MNLTSHQRAPVKAHSVIEALSGKKRTRPPWAGNPRKRTSEASMTPPWAEITTSSPGVSLGHRVQGVLGPVEELEPALAARRQGPLGSSPGSRRP